MVTAALTANGEIRPKADLAVYKTFQSGMPNRMTIEDVIACLDAFVPGEESENIDQLYQCLEPLATHAPAARLPAVPAMLRLIERSADAEFGSPGPLVHELESIPGYEPLLLESLQRQPEGLTVWMANRI